MKTIRVALMSMRPRLRDILTDAISREPDMEVVAAPGGPASTLNAGPPDVLVGESQNPLDAGPPSGLLRAVPGARVLMVSGLGDQAAVYELRPTRAVIGTVGIHQVIEAIRFGLNGPSTGQPESGGQGQN